MSAEIDAANAPVKRFAAGENLVLSVVAAGFARGEILATTTTKSYRIGLLELSEMLDFAIDLNAESTEASGWFISPSNDFYLNIDEEGVLTAQSVGNQTVLGSDNYQIDGDLMVDVEYLSQWFGLTFTLDEARLSLSISSNLPLPFEAAERRRQQQSGGNYRASVSVLPPIDNSYRAFTPPLMDFQSFLQTTSTNTHYAYSVVSRQDLAFLSTNLFLAGDKNESLRDARLTFYKDSPAGDLFSPLDLTQISFGDVLPINAGIGNTAGFGRGISFNNLKDQLADNRQVNFTGMIQAGWDVELYRNGILLANDFNIQEGRYQFTDVELLFGNNDFELVFYGPQGQIERRSESYIVDQNALRPNQDSFRFSLVDSNKTLLGVRELGDNPTQDGLHAGLVYERGITDWLSLGIGAVYQEPTVGSASEQFSLRNNLSFGRFGILNSVVLWDNENRNNLLTSYRTRKGDTSFGFRWQQNRVPLVQDGIVNTIESDTYGINVSGKLFSGTGYTIGHENIWQKTNNDSTGDSETFRQSISMLTKAGSFNHSLIGLKADTQVDDDWFLTGEFGYRGRFGRVFTRLFSTFDYKPELDLKSVGAVFNYPINNNLSSELRYAYNVDMAQPSYDARVNWQGEYLTLSGFASYSDSNNWSIKLTARFSLGLSTEDNGMLMTSRSISQTGALAVRVFEDLDLDQKYDEGEPLLDDVDVRAAQVFRNDATKHGTAFINRLPANRRTDIVVDESTLPDYNYLRLDKGFAVTGRRGLLQFADIPFTRGGELDGTVYFVNAAGKEAPLPYVKLNLVNEQGDIVASTKSEFDGFYLFEKVLPGDYRLFIDQRTLTQRNAIQEVTKKLNISNKGDLFTEIDVLLRELSNAKGYIAQVGSFKSLILLKVYVGLLQKRVPPQLISDIFYLPSSGNEHFRIGINYSKDRLQAERSCQYAAQFQVDCQVEYVQFDY